MGITAILYIKRIFDVVLSLLLTPFAVVICLVIAIVILITEKENPFFAQKRIGLKQREFTILKIRTMRENTAHVSTHEVDKASITKLGGFLRATKLDELPQIWNVLIGDMSFVGPRPGLPTQMELIEEREKLNIYSIRPGVTGHSQVLGIDMSEPARLAKTDAEYLNNITIMRDLKLLVATAFGAGSGDKTV